MWLSWLRTRHSVHEDVGLITGPAQWNKDLALPQVGSGIAVSCGVGHRSDSDSELLWLRYRPAEAAPIQLLAWEPPYAVGVALKSKQQQQTKNLHCEAFSLPHPPAGLS